MDKIPLEDEKYLASSEVIDWQESSVLKRASTLYAGDVIETTRRCFEFVRDDIAHSIDIGAEELTCSASEVLHLGHGYCYAKAIC